MDIVKGNSRNIDLQVSYAVIELEVNPNPSIELIQLGTQGLTGPQGPVGPEGPKGDPLEFQALTEQQKIELRGDVGNTSTNYTNLFNSVLLS